MDKIIVTTKEEVESLITTLINPKFEELKELFIKSYSPQKVTYTVEEVAEILNVAKLTVYNYIKNGKIKAFKVGRSYTIKVKDLEAALSEVKSLKYRRG